VIIVSHRGPASYARGDDGELMARQAPGGLASTLRSLLAGSGATWVAAAVSDADREAAGRGATDVDGIDVRLLALDPNDHRLAYDVISNGALWFLHHGLFDIPRRPRFDRRFEEAWRGYEAMNEAFAHAAVERAADGDVVLVQDYHLTLVPGMLRHLRPDLRVAHFSHTPFCGPNSIRMLPDAVATAMCGSMASAACGFHTARWARAYEASARQVLGAEAPITPPFVAPLGVDVDALTRAAAEPAVAHAVDDLDARIGARTLILRVDRVEPSKNVVRGFLAFDLMLDEHPEWRDRVVFVSRLYPSRESLADYLAYRQEVEQAVAAVNRRWATDTWTPILLDTGDDFDLSLAAYRRYDVLLVNPVKDGMNVVAKEGPVLNERDGVLVLSRDAGAVDELSDAALVINPFDIGATADALHTALTMDDHERSKRGARLHELISRRTTRDWLDDQIAHAT